MKKFWMCANILRKIKFVNDIVYLLRMTVNKSVK